MSEQKIHAAMIAVMREVEAIGKDQRNQAQNFKFRGIDQCYNYLHGLLAKHGIITLPDVLEKFTEQFTNTSGKLVTRTVLRIRYVFMAEDGSTVDCVMEGEGMDHGDKSTSKAAAIAHKYALLQTFLIPTEEQKDPDYESHEIAAREERREQEARQNASRSGKPNPIPKAHPSDLESPDDLF